MGLWLIVKIVGVRRWCSTGLGSLRLVLMRGKGLLVLRVPVLVLMRSRRERLAEAVAKCRVVQCTCSVPVGLRLQQTW